ncbi:MAG: hypothetical protein MO846_12425, partial [Candidatus Devosia symbiotica]|nr:hypothetical protein [Candidatus Devosia symbiotica]
VKQGRQPGIIAIVDQQARLSAGQIGVVAEAQRRLPQLVEVGNIFGIIDHDIFTSASGGRCDGSRRRGVPRAASRMAEG